MINSKTRLTNIGIVNCTDSQSSANWRIPRPYLYNNIEMIWYFLEETVNDWLNKSTPFNEKIASSYTEGFYNYHEVEAFSSLQPYYLKTLFSYVMFFVSLKEVYELFYRDLKNLNKELQLRIKLGKRPKENPYIEKVKKIRNISITHIGDNKNKYKNNKATPIAAATWAPMSIERPKNRPLDINDLTFCPGKTVLRDSDGNIAYESDDLEIKGIPELHSNCTDYLDKFDLFCAEILKKISCELPLKIGDKEYSMFK